MSKEAPSKTWMWLYQFFELRTPTTVSNMNESLKMRCFISSGATHGKLNCSIQRLKGNLFLRNTAQIVGTHKHTYTLTLETEPTSLQIDEVITNVSLSMQMSSTLCISH